jgi:hypothetical protein
MVQTDNVVIGSSAALVCLENKNCPMCRQPIVKIEELSIDYIKELNEKRKDIYF